MLVDANILLYSIDVESVHHQTAARWLTGALNGDRRVAFPWLSIGAFLRISTNPRIVANPLTPEAASRHVAAWLAADTAWVPPAGDRTAGILLDLMATHRVTANLIPDAQLVALAIEHGLTIYSADTDFARFPEIRWYNPLA